MKELFFTIIQAIVIALVAPLVSGIMRKMKNNLRMRRGPGIFQPYYNIAKLWAKDEVVSENASWIFRSAPVIVLAAGVMALLLVPAFMEGVALRYAGDFLLIIFVLAAGRFFLALAGLDTGSAFGGMGASREVFIAGLAEPVTLLALLAVAMANGTGSLAVISAGSVYCLSTLLAAIALLAVTIAETSRIPVDNQETHLELTMVHEAMVLEYSGRSLAMIEYASHVKQMVFFSILAVVIPVRGGSLYGIGVYAAKILCISAIIVLVEVSVAKMRLFRVVDFLAFAAALAGMAVVFAAGGL